MVLVANKVDGVPTIFTQGGNMRFFTLIVIVGMSCAEEEVRKVPVHVPIKPLVQDKKAGAAPRVAKEMPGWHGYVLVRPSRNKLGFFLSVRDHDEIVVRADSVVADVPGDNGEHCAVFPVPAAFNSFVKDVLVCGSRVKGRVHLPGCVFSYESEELPWPIEDGELKGRLFHLLLPSDQKAHMRNQCPGIDRGGTVDVSTKQKK